MHPSIPGGPGSVGGPGSGVYGDGAIGGGTGSPMGPGVYGDVALPTQDAVALAPALADPTPLYSATWVAPDPLAHLRIPSLTPLVTVSGHSSTGVSMTLQVQTSVNDNSFTSPTTTTLTGVAQDVNTSTAVGPFANGNVVYFRVRAGDGSSIWSDWALGGYITIDTTSGNNHSYIYENVGFGTDLPPLQNNHSYAYENVGVQITLGRDNISWAWEGDVNTTTPNPHIWFIKPTSGRSGDGFVIYGHGFGSPQSQYSGLLQFLEGGIWTTIGVAAWTLIAAGAHAYDALRTLDPTIPYIDMEHNEVTVTIPSGLVPPGYLLRIETNGP